MMDCEIWAVMQQFLKALERLRSKTSVGADEYGSAHIGLFGDFKQLPPATSKAPFIVLGSVRNSFTFRVLRENRRVKDGEDARRAELDNFHAILDDISYGRDTERVRQFFVQAYLRAALDSRQTADKAELEESVAVLTKRRYRDNWNRAVLKRIASKHGHSLKVRAQVHGITCTRAMVQRAAFETHPAAGAHSGPFAPAPRWRLER